ncbi:glycoside hydrolase family 2 TIM barrel-domain containing protein [Myroides sp. LJL119]
MIYKNPLLKHLCSILILISTQIITAQNFPFSNSIPGYSFSTDTILRGKHWESPEQVALNKQLPKAYQFSFDDPQQARKVLKQNSPNYLSLNGTWRFFWVPHPDQRPIDFYKTDFNNQHWDTVKVPMNWNLAGLEKNGNLKYGKPIYVNQPVIFYHKVEKDDYKKGVMRTPPENWTTYQHRNEVGSYTREFDLPKSWQNKQIYINFDGVDSFFYLWINGKFVGFSKNSRNQASFDITNYLNTDKPNKVSVEVYRNSDGSFLEAQDMFRLPGIFREVSLQAKPKVQLSNMVIIPDLDPQYTEGTLQVSSQIKNLDKKIAKGYKLEYALYQNELYSDNNTLVYQSKPIKLTSSISPNQQLNIQNTIAIKQPLKWSAEAPYRYTLVVSLLDSKNKVIESVSSYTGFRKVEIKQTPAHQDEFSLQGRYFYINGKPVKLKGVNRHETNPTTGHVISEQQMLQEIQLLKRANINHVRNAHYPDDPYWYYLCDKYGIYLEDEANIESHQYYYGQASLSHPKEWENAHVARNLEMVHATINHPSIVIWSLGNEAGPGDNFVAAYNAIKAIDDSRPIQYERNNQIVDMGSNQYPSIGWVQEAVKGQYPIKYPFHISEYAHSMGNAAGNLVDYWNAIESTNFFVGGAIWDWVDQSLYNYDKDTHEKYLAYGGDFQDTPNDGMFVMNGLLFGDLTPKPQYYEVKKVYQNIQVTPVDISKGKLEIFNKNYFTNLSDYQLKYTILQNGVPIASGINYLGPDISEIGPRQKKEIQIDLSQINFDPQSEYFMVIDFLTLKDNFWSKKGYVQMQEQILLQSPLDKPQINTTIHQSTDLTLIQTKDTLKVTGKDFLVSFDNKTGSIADLIYQNTQVFYQKNGPKLDAFRAPMDNDNWAYKTWFLNGLHNLEHKVTQMDHYYLPNKDLVITYRVTSQAAYASQIHGGSSGKYTITDLKQRPFDKNDFYFNTYLVYTIYKDGSVELQSSISANNNNLSLAHIGYTMQVNPELINYTYYGKGPFNNYNDRKTGAVIAQYESKVENLYVPWTKPQSTGNREQVRWASLTNSQDLGVVFIADQEFSASALPYSELELTLAPHSYELPHSNSTHLYLLDKVTGLGGNSCGQGPPLPEDRVKSTALNFGFIIRPVANKDYNQKAQVSSMGQTPIVIHRDNQGYLHLLGKDGQENIMVQINQQQPFEYKQPILQRAKAKIKAWPKDNPRLISEQEIQTLENINLSVLAHSSVETSYGDPQNLLDNDPSTIWHSMYSVTVAQYPHWIIFDTQETKNIKGFVYQHRQEGKTGNVKEFQIHLSNDTKDWTKVYQGEFLDQTMAQKILFDSPQKARYIRFTALSSHNGQDYASAAEFSVLEEQ